MSKFQEVFAKVTLFDLTDVKRAYARKHGLTSEQVDQHEQELKRYLTLCIVYPEACLGMFSLVDNLWHEFVCHTPKYRQFCESIAGRFLDHIPTGSDAARSLSSPGPSARQQTITLYERHFGPMDRTLWRIDDASADDCCTICTSDKKITQLPSEQAAASL